MSNAVVTIELFGSSNDIFSKVFLEDDLDACFKQASATEIDCLEDYFFGEFESELENDGLLLDSIAVRTKDSGDELVVNIDTAYEHVEAELDVRKNCYVIEIIQMWKGVFGTCEISVDECGLCPEKISLLTDDSENKLLGIKYNNEDIEINTDARDMRGIGSVVSCNYYDNDGNASIIDLDKKYTDFLKNKKTETSSSDQYLENVKNDGLALRDVPENQIDRNLCIVALKNNGEALEFVPEHFKDKELCSLAVECSWRALIFVPSSVKDRDMCLTAVRHDGRALGKVPDELKDIEICVTAVREFPSAMFDIPENLTDEVKKLVDES
jgi:hypothetical protein